MVIDADKGMTRRAWVGNHLGFAEGITGPELVDNGRAQAERAGAVWVEGTAESVEKAADGFTVRTDAGDTFTASNVLLATGTSARARRGSRRGDRPRYEPRIKTIVAVDAEGRTSVPGIWAAGTAAGRQRAHDRHRR